MANKIQVETEDGEILEYLVEGISTNLNVFQIVDKNGKNIPAGLTITENKQKTFYLFDGFWIENGEVTTLGLIGKERKYKIGKLLPYHSN